MASIERTAYPRLNKRMSDEELCARYELTDGERRFIDMNANGGRQRLTLTALLKTRQQLGFSPGLTHENSGLKGIKDLYSAMPYFGYHVIA